MLVLLKHMCIAPTITYFPGIGEKSQKPEKKLLQAIKTNSLKYCEEYIFF